MENSCVILKEYGFEEFDIPELINMAKAFTIYFGPKDSNTKMIIKKMHELISKILDN